MCVITEALTVITAPCYLFLREKRFDIDSSPPTVRKPSDRRELTYSLFINSIVINPQRTPGCLLLSYLIRTIYITLLSMIFYFLIRHGDLISELRII